MADLPLGLVGNVAESSEKACVEATMDAQHSQPSVGGSTNYLMEGQTNLVPAVTWVSVGTADLTGAGYTGPGVLVVPSIHIGLKW